MPRILVVDDEPNVLRLIQVNLERQGYVVETAPSAAHALEMLRACRPDLLICDVMMPEMDGFELMEIVRRDPTLARLPVFLLPPRDFDAEARARMRLITDVWLPKPFNPAELIVMIKRFWSDPKEDGVIIYNH